MNKYMISENDIKDIIAQDLGVNVSEVKLENRLDGIVCFVNTNKNLKGTVITDD